MRTACSWHCVRWLLCVCGCCGARAATFYVTVAGLGGEPDYEQRFTANAKDLDKVFKAAAGAHVVTLTGKQSTKAKLAEALGEVAREAKPEDDFVLTLIGHGSFDGAEYKFNLVGPDMSAAELAALCDRVPAQAAADCGYDERERRRGGCAGAAGTGGDCGDEVGHGEERDGVCAVLGGGLQDPTADTDKSDHLSAMEAFAYADRKTAAFYASQKRLATEHAEFEDTGKGEAVRVARRRAARARCLRADGGADWRGAGGDERSGEAGADGEEGRAGAEGRCAEVSEGGDGAGRVQEGVDGGAGGVGEGAGGVGQVKRCAPSRGSLLAVALGCRLRLLRRRATPEGCRALRLHGKKAEATTCFEALARSGDAYMMAEGYWGWSSRRRRSRSLRWRLRSREHRRCGKVRYGMLLHERFNNKDAAELFREALKQDPNSAQAYLGLAMVSADGFDEKASEYIGKAIALDPKLVEAHELAANLALEDAKPDEAMKEADTAIALSPYRRRVGCAGCDGGACGGGPACGQNADARGVAREDRGGESGLWRGLCAGCASPGAESPVHGWGGVLPQGGGGGSAAWAAHSQLGST